jgi:hypothetical protein
MDQVVWQVAEHRHGKGHLVAVTSNEAEALEVVGLRE